MSNETGAGRGLAEPIHEIGRGPHGARDLPREDLLRRASGARAGKVWLVGAGPGDADLITVRALKVLARAEVALVDALVNPALLDELPGTCQVLDVGKRAGCRSTPQAFIGRLIVRKARQGLRVVRLKGGDPSIFGRAAEELAECHKAGVECEIVPGITSASAAAATACMPLTDRACGPGVAFVAGHVREGGEEPDWRALAQSGLTLVVYMGVARADRIREGLLAAGRPIDLPVAIVENASLPGERVTPTTLGAMLGAMAERQVRAPALLVIGRAAAAAARAEPAGPWTRAA